MKAKKQYQIGTSGWNYPHWRKRFYPETVSRKDWFGYYCEHFGTVEINNTFYRWPTKAVLEKWQADAPGLCLHPEGAAHDHPHEKTEGLR
ncbi:MAG: DUF72 domain-containing protein [Candidatus Marinimicrobia bacterium]|nr:DUF72 domain-containing protein [Candidatus Neomarinimicrobiota bacterium]